MAARPTPLTRKWFARPADVVAAELVGAVIVAAGPGGTRRARLVETEAYVGAHDLACHARAGITRRTAVMFGPAGHAYVFRIYGLHWMLNVVTGPEGSGQAVLLRAAEPLGDWDVRLCGPALLAAGFGVTGRDSGQDLCSGPLVIVPGTRPERVDCSARIGVAYAGAWAAAPLRFFDPVSRAVSTVRRRR